MSWRPYPVRIVTGPHSGLAGYVVSVPWLGNLWNTRMEVNVPAGGQDGTRRAWVKVWRWQVEQAEGRE
jgi:hypothetical protein